MWLFTKVNLFLCTIKKIECSYPSRQLRQYVIKPVLVRYMLIFISNSINVPHTVYSSFLLWLISNMWNQVWQKVHIIDQNTQDIYIYVIVGRLNLIWPRQRHEIFSWFFFLSLHQIAAPVGPIRGMYTETVLILAEYTKMKLTTWEKILRGVEQKE